MAKENIRCSSFRISIRSIRTRLIQTSESASRLDAFEKEVRVSLRGKGVNFAYAQQAIREKLLDHKSYISQYGDDMPEIRDWKWGGADAVKSTKSDTAADNV